MTAQILPFRRPAPPSAVTAAEALAQNYGEIDRMRARMRGMERFLRGDGPEAT